MILQITFSLLLCRANSLDVNVAYDMIKSALEYYNSHSILLIFDESRSDSDLFKILTIQKRLSSGNNLYYSSITTPVGLWGSLEKYRENLRETAVIWDPSEELPHILEKVSDETGISSHRWFVTTSNLTSEAFKNITIPLNSEFVIARGNPRSGYDLEEIYDVTPGMRLSNPLGRWSLNSQEFQLQASTYMFERRKDFQGATIKVAAPPGDPCDLISFFTRTTSMAECCHEQVWHMMEKVFNATTSLQVVPDLNDETLLGDFDLTFRYVHTSSDAMNTRDFVWPTFFVEVLVATSYVTQKVKWNTFTLPFTERMWMVILIWIVLWDLVLAFVQYIIEAKKKNSFFDFYNENSFSTMFSFCSQGDFCHLKASSVRITLLMMFIVPAVLFPGYSAVLTSFLTVHLEQKPFRNIEELSHHKDYKLGWLKSFNIEDILNTNAMNSINEKIIKNNILPRDKLPVSDEEGILRVCNEKFSYLTIIDILLLIKSKCKSYRLDERFLMFCVSMELKKGSWYKFYLDRCLKAVLYSGVRRRFVRHLLREFIYFDAITIIDKSQVPPIKVENIILPFLVLLLGVIVSVILLLLEIIFFRLKIQTTPLIPLR